MATSSVKEFAVTFLMPEKCFEELFVHLHLHVPCLMFVMGKVAGFWILMDTLLEQLPQLLKILWRGSAEGLNLASFLLQLYAFSCPVVYAVANNFPFFAWAEKIFMLAQTVAIIFLILHHHRNTLTGLLFIPAYGSAVFVLGSYAAAAAVSVMHASTVPSLIASKVLQARTNYYKGHTGQLSTLSLLLAWAGSLGRTFLSVQETGMSFAALAHMLSACLSCVLLAQVICYKNRTNTKQKSQ